MPTNTYFIVKIIKLDLEENVTDFHFEVHDSDGYVSGPYISYDDALDYVNDLTHEPDNDNDFSPGM